MNKLTRSGPLKVLASLLVAAVLLVAAPLTRATILVTDLDGDVTRNGKSVDLLATLAPGERLRLAGGAHLVVAFVQQSREFSATGPGEYRIDSKALVALAGAAKPQMRELPEVYRRVKLDVARLGQAGVRLRGEPTKLLLSPTGLVATPPSFFHWPENPAAEAYVFRLADARRNLIYEARLLDPALSLPDSIRLKPGAVYFWGVELAGSGREAAWTRLRIATNPALARQIEAARPEAQAPRSEQVLFSLAAELPLPN